MVKDEKKKTAVDRYKSPARKLIPFFKNSRDKWKAKYQEVKYKAKLMQNRIRYMGKRAVALKQKLKALEKELQSVKNKKQNLAHELECLKKTADTDQKSGKR
jgi:uncharacterized protein YlxW (UPF0749 family)